MWVSAKVWRNGDDRLEDALKIILQALKNEQRRLV